MPEAVSETTNRLVALIREKGRWPSVGKALLAAEKEEAWIHDGFATSTSWLDRLAALGGRSTTYLSRCLSAARYLTKLQFDDPRPSVSHIWDRPLTDIEAFRREVEDDENETVKRLPELSSGTFTSRSARKQAPGKATRLSFPDIVLEALPDLLSKLGCPRETTVLVEPRTPVFRPDAVLVDPSGKISILEVKGSLSGRLLPGLFQQLLALSSLGERVWLVLPSDSEIPGQTIINQLRSIAVAHVGLMLLNPSTREITQILPPETDAPSSESRTAFRKLVQAAQHGEPE